MFRNRTRTTSPAGGRSERRAADQHARREEILKEIPRPASGAMWPAAFVLLAGALTILTIAAIFGARGWQPFFSYFLILIVILGGTGIYGLTAEARRRIGSNRK